MGLTQTPPPPESDLFLEIAKGNVTGNEFVGINFATSGLPVQSDFDIVWPLAQTVPFVFPPSASTMTLSSDNANDTNSGGTGSRTIEIKGLDTGFVEQEEIVFLNGLTPVTTANSYLRVNGLSNIIGGTTGYNEGTIYMGTGTVTAGVPAVIYQAIAPTEGASQSGAYTVPIAKEIFFSSLIVNSDEKVEIRVRIRVFTQAVQTVTTFIVESLDSLNYRLGALGLQGSDVWVEARSVTGTAQIGGAAGAILIG